MSHFPRWADERICDKPQPCAAGDGMIQKGEYIVLFWLDHNSVKFFHGRCSDLYDDEGNFDGGQP